MPPTQVQYPGRATLRTITAVIVVAIPTYALIVPIVLDQMGEYITPSLRNWLIGSVAFVAALTGAITRIMAVPAVNRALETLGLSAAPAASAPSPTPPEPPTP